MSFLERITAIPSENKKGGNTPATVVYEIIESEHGMYRARFLEGPRSYPRRVVGLTQLSSNPRKK